MGNHTIKLKVNTNREHLINTLKNNRELHNKTYEQALEKYWELEVKFYTKALASVTEKKSAKYNLRNNAKPRNYSEQYDLVISMLEQSTEETIQIDSSDYRAFVLDEWDWSDEWKTSTASYYDGDDD